jgi:serine phosphatase RsbU (regulator of sigma subunit)
LGIRSCFVATYEGWGTPPAKSRLIVAYDRGRLLDLPPGGLLFDTQLLAPSELLGDRQRSMVVEPLFFETIQLGFGSFELGPRRRVVYELLRELVSAALHGAELMGRVAREAEARQKAEKQRLEQELALATRIQTSILPRNLDVRGLEIAASMQPATEVGGDYYDVLPTDQGCWLGIGDVAGHGLGAGLVMMMMQSIVAALVHAMPEASPRQLLSIVNAVLYENVRQRMLQDQHATLSLLRYREDGSLEFAGAHEDLLIFRAASRTVELVPTEGTWVGATRDIEAANHDSKCQLLPGDVLLVYTDGLIEAQNAGGEQFGSERLMAAFLALGELSPEKIRQGLTDAVQAFMAEQRDDIAVLVARYRGAPER